MQIENLKEQCPLPRLMRHLGMEQYARASCKSPFRADEKPSWGIYERSGYYYFKDHGGTGDHGDEITFLARYLRIEEKQNFKLLLQVYERIASELKPDTAQVHRPELGKAPSVPNRDGFSPGTKEQLAELAQLRSIKPSGLEWAQERGVLTFGQFAGKEVYGVTDRSGYVLELRQLNGENFPEHKDLLERKSHAVAGSQKRWPVGILEAKEAPSVLLVEGLPDFLAAHDFILREQGPDPQKIQCVPVAMLSASANITEEAASLFADKKVIIFPHADERGDGLRAALRWKKQLEGAKDVRFFDTTKLHVLSGGKIKDLNDFIVHYDELRPQLPNKILPRG